LRALKLSVDNKRQQLAAVNSGRQICITDNQQLKEKENKTMEKQNIDESLNKIAKEISVLFGDITYIATQKCVCGGGTIKEGSTREIEITEKLVLPSEIKQIINDYIQKKISALKI